MDATMKNAMVLYALHNYKHKALLYIHYPFYVVYIQ